jgi:hypothetical protein
MICYSLPACCDDSFVSSINIKKTNHESNSVSQLNPGGSSPCVHRDPGTTLKHINNKNRKSNEDLRHRKKHPIRGQPHTGTIERSITEIMWRDKGTRVWHRMGA